MTGSRLGMTARAANNEGWYNPPRPSRRLLRSLLRTRESKRDAPNEKAGSRGSPPLILAGYPGFRRGAAGLRLGEVHVGVRRADADERRHRGVRQFGDVGQVDVHARGGGTRK